MSRKRIAQAQILLSIQLNHLIFVAGAVSVMGLSDGSNSYLLLWLVLGIIPVALYILRVKAKRIPVFFAGLLAVLVPALFLPVHLLAKFLIIGMLLAYAIITIRKKMSENPETAVLATPFVYLLLIGGLTFRQHAYTSLCLGLTWVYLLGYFLYHYMTEYLRFVDIHEKSASNVPEKELFLQGMKQVSVFAGIAVVITFLTSNTEWMAKIFAVIGDWLMAILRVLVAALAKKLEEESTRRPQMEVPEQSDVLGAATYSDWWLKIQKLLEVLYEVAVVVIIVAIIFLGVFLVIRFVQKNFTQEGKKKKAKTILSNQDIRESVVTETTHKEKKGFFDFLSNEQRIRALYKKRVLKEKERIVGEAVQQELGFKTAKECCEKIEDTELKEAYEKARYSAEKITVEDVRRAKGGNRY